jgi:putative PIN family toxin of toxin-antitoxin system
LRRALEAGRLRCAVAEDTLEEWRRVLAYREFALDVTQQEALLARYRALSEMTVAFDVAPTLPFCSDPDDQKFIELAAATVAHALVSKDRAVLKLRRRCAPYFRIMTPAEAVRWLDSMAA